MFWQDEWQRKFDERYVYMKPEERLKRAGTDPKIVFPLWMFGDIVITDDTGTTWNEVLRSFRKLRENARDNAYVTFGVRKKSPLLEPLCVVSLRLQEVRIFSHTLYTYFVL